VARGTRERGSLVFSVVGVVVVVLSCCVVVVACCSCSFVVVARLGEVVGK
jgi:hypothetical protein